MEGGEGRVAVSALLAGRYRLGRLLSDGPACAVHEARDLLLERDVVVKVVHGLRDDMARSSAVRAARAAARVSHPHVVRVLDVQQGYPTFLVVEALDARPLDVRRLAAFPPERLIALGDDLLAGLAALHAVGAVHADVREENVLVTREGRTVLTSTGIANAALGTASAGADVAAAAALLRHLLGPQAPPAVEAVLEQAAASAGPGGYPDAAAFRAALRGAGELRRRLAAAAAPEPVPTPGPQVVPAPTPGPQAVPTPGPGPASTPGPALPLAEQPADSEAGAHALPVMSGGGPRLTWGLVVAAAVVVVVLGIGLFAQRARTTAAPTPPAPASTAPAARPSPSAQPSSSTTASPEPTTPPPAAGTALDELLARGDLAPETQGDRALLVRLRELRELAGAERARRAAQLLGRIVEDTREGVLSRAVARDAFDALASEVTPEGLVALAEADLAAVGPGGAVFVERLRGLSELQGQQRGREAAALFGLASGADTGLAEPFRAAASAVLLGEVTLEGLVALAEADLAAVGPGGAAFVERLRGLTELQGAQRAGEAAALLREVDTSGDELAPSFRAAAVQVLRPIAAGGPAAQTGSA